MSDSKQETIADIVAEMLEFAETDSQSIGRDVLRRRIQDFARRFAAAAKRADDQWRAALKPVLDIEIDMNTSDMAMSMAIKEAKRIYAKQDNFK